MNLERMLHKCERDQWSIDDLDWSVTPKEMSKEDEMAVVQYFKDMSGIERLAKALFAEQRRRTTEPTLRRIFETFIVDEERHAQVAERLSQHYDVHQYRRYELNENFKRFRPHFERAITKFSPEVANAYILAGELILDVALLRSIDDHVDDEMSHQAMRLINRDESRHIAIDYHMVEFYGSDEYEEWLQAQPPKSLRERIETLSSVAKMMYHAKPFFKEVFFEPMETVDPEGRRIKEAMKRVHLVANKPGAKRRGFAKMMNGLQNAYNKPLVRDWFGPAIARVAGVPGDMLIHLYTQAELERAGRMSFDEMAEEALAAKNN